MKLRIMKRALWIGAACLAGAGHAEDFCAERATVVDRLAAEYGETRRAIGLASAQQVVEIFASPETGSWTITVTRPDGTSCLVAAGTYFETLDEALTPAMTGDPT